MTSQATSSEHEELSPLEELRGILTGIRRTVQALVWATMILFLIIGAVVVYSLITSSKTHDALCTFRGNLVTQVNQTDDFLASHPEGLPKLGLSADQLQAQEARQRASVDSLAGLSCGGPDLQPSNLPRG